MRLFYLNLSINRQISEFYKVQNYFSETIPTNFLIDYLNTGHSPKIDLKPLKIDEENIDKLSWVDWQRIFKNHEILNNAEFWSNAKRKTIDIDFRGDPVTCMKITGDYILSGHHSGLICLWSDEDSHGLMMDAYDDCHNCLVTDILPIGQISHQFL